MITELQLANVLQFSVVVVFGLVVVFKVLPEVQIDSFRQRMFAVRDELFDYAADGNISFEHPAYVLLREQMNGFIRYAHHLTVFRMLMTIAIHKIRKTPPPSIDWQAQWQRAVDSIGDERVRDRLRKFHFVALNMAMKRLLSGSPLLWAATLIFAVQMLLQGAVKGMRQWIRSAAKKALTGPINDRTIEDVAQGAFA
ncbi:MAG TPA: hypothetical protein VMU71_11055 [Terracidiphilus sp.]|nr:hypothetical protein [Terracidiphilus sp.]